MMLRRKLIVVDLLCGAGGSSTGAKKAIARRGYGMDLRCLNHWPVAVYSHALNHPDAVHYCQNVEIARPSVIVPEGRIDLFLASPSCTHHSVARGGKPTSDQQRSDPWHLIPWLTELDVDRAIIENVWEITKWGPVDPITMRPIKERECEYHNLWINLWHGLNYELEFRKLNAANYGTAQTRQRYIMLAKKRRPTMSRVITWPTVTHGKTAPKPWRPAREIIDWSIKGKSIFTRKKPLSPKTLARIEAGLVKFSWPEPFLIVLRNHMAGRSLDEPVSTLTGGGTHIGLVEPVPFVMATGSTGAPRSVKEPSPTITTGGAGTEGHRGCARPMLVEAFVLSQASGGAPRATHDPLPTAVGGGAIAMISPYYGSGSGETCCSVENPLPTATGKARFGLVVPITHSDGSNRARNIDVDPMPTVTTAHRGEHALVTGEAPQYDILFRMLEPHELAAAMGFNSDEARYEFAGNKTEQIKQIGNAVPVELMDACVTAILDDLDEEIEPAPQFMEAAE